MTMTRVQRTRWLAGSLAAILISVCLAYAQPRWGFREGRTAPRFPSPGQPADGAFSFCRLMYKDVRWEPMGMGWRTDYPYAEINLMVRLSELTKAPVSFTDRGRPNHYVVRLTDEALFNCSFVMASDVGTIGLSTEEIDNLRAYLLKGGFLWVDDFWGTAAWEQWSGQIRQVLPPVEYPVQDVTIDDPLLSGLYQIEKFPQITNIQFWRRVGGGTTSERGLDSIEPHVRTIRDSHGRIMVLMTHNTDIADSWEREGEDPGFFYQF